MKIKSKGSRIFVIFLLVFFACSTIYAQEYKNIFDSPMKIPLYSTGSFAELRGSHFHSGLDIRTYGKTGYNVYAPEDGYISRIKVQAFGGGKNLYISHPNGYTTVYMHLEREIMTIWHRFDKNKFCRSNCILPLASIIHLLASLMREMK